MPIDMRVTFFTIALRVIDEKTITCAKPMRVRFILLEVFPLQINTSSEPQLGCVKLPITFYICGWNHEVWVFIFLIVTIFFVLPKNSIVFLSTIWATTWQNQQNECAPSKDSDQPEHPPSLSSCRQWRLWSDWADAQADVIFTGRTLILIVLSCCGSFVFYVYCLIVFPDSTSANSFSQPEMWVASICSIDELQRF